VSERAAHVRIATALFAGLGAQVGLWVVLVPELVRSRDLTAGELGVALGVLAATSILSLLAAGRLADRIGRRPLACAGAAGMGVALVLLGAVEARSALLPTLVLYGLANGLLDLASNTVGADVEREHGERVMIRLHAGFSGAAAALALLTAAALAAGADHRALYAAGGVALIALALIASRAPLPPHPGASDAVAGGSAPDPADLGRIPAPPTAGPRPSTTAATTPSPPTAGPRPSITAATTPSPPTAGPRPPITAATTPSPPTAAAATPRPPAAAAAPRGGLLRAPGVLVALALITLCFLGDGAIEGYVPLYLRDLLGAGALLTGIGVAAFHSASLAGRLTAARAQARLGERGLITAAGVGASAGMLVVVLADAPALAAAGLLLVGASLAPVVPTALSVAGRADPRRAGAAVSLVTTVGYSAFVVGPPLVGALADATSLRTALVPVVVTTALLALVARRL
jgi:MFS family permease